MHLKLALIALLAQCIIAQQYKCNQRSALLLLKRPAYEFSMRILDRVTQNTDAHFVFSPLSTWVQLIALAEGAKGKTFSEIWKVTRHHRKRCFKAKLGQMLQKLDRDLRHESRRKSVMVIDELLAVKKNYIRDVQRFCKVKVMLENFGYPETSAQEVNNEISKGTNGMIKESVYKSDFDATMLLMSDNLYFKSAWRHPFNPSYTKLEPFHSFNDINDVMMMNQIGYFNMTEMPLINAKVLEIPCQSDVSMLVFLPINNEWIGNIFYELQRTKLTAIYNVFKDSGEKLVDVKLPKFKVNTTIDNLPELLYDMGVRRIFNPERSELDNISRYRTYASLMTQTVDIVISEEGVRGRSSADFLVNETSAEKLEFIANRPFAYLIADRQTQFILFAGVLSHPNEF